MTQGSIGSNVNIQQFNTITTRYNMAISSHQFDYCINLDKAIAYEIIMVDSQSGEEVITMDGRGCEKAVAEEFLKKLNAL